MKKIFTSLLMLTAIASASAEITLQKGADGSVVYHDGDVISVGYTAINAVISKWDPELFINSTTPISAEVSVSSPVLNVQFCAGGQCVTSSPTTPAVKTLSLAANVPQALKIDVMGKITLEAPIDAKIDVSAFGESVSFTLRFLPTEESAALDGIGADANGISFNGRVLSYNVDAPTQLTIFTISGQPALSRSISGHGSMQLDALPGGVYLYRAGNRTGKFVVR
ncbi:MAG: T9SS type A sorting domain-containing protein [Muribaculaceae bacterium]|nr:T9SS type A sorting domain-containing protein [Muribaculaceae bacterium]